MFMELNVFDVIDGFAMFFWVLPVVPHKAVAEVSEIGNL